MAATEGASQTGAASVRRASLTPRATLTAAKTLDNVLSQRTLHSGQSPVSMDTVARPVPLRNATAAPGHKFGCRIAGRYFLVSVRASPESDGKYQVAVCDVREGEVRLPHWGNSWPVSEDTPKCPCTGPCLLPALCADVLAQRSRSAEAAMAAGLRMHMRHAEGGDTGEIQTHGDDSGAPSATGHDPDTVACTHHTLIIGINDYPHLHHGDADGLLGAVIDTKLWLEIARVRAALCSSSSECVLINAEATRNRILTELWALVGTQPPPAALPLAAAPAAAITATSTPAQRGDYILVHFSGHGSRMASTLPTGLTRTLEAIVPHDSGRGHRPNLDILDEEIAMWLQAMLRVTPHVQLSFDCCHGGGMARGPESERLQSSPAHPAATGRARFVSEPRMGGGVQGHPWLDRVRAIPLAGAARTDSEGTASEASQAGTGVPWLPTATGVFLGACMPSEIASETVAALPVHPIGAPDAHTPPRVMMPGGLLSVCAWTAFHDCLQNEALEELTYHCWHRRVLALFAQAGGLEVRQHPVMIGEMDTPVLPGAAMRLRTVRTRPGFLVLPSSRPQQAGPVWGRPQTQAGIAAPLPAAPTSSGRLVHMGGGVLDGVALGSNWLVYGGPVWSSGAGQNARFKLVVSALYPRRSFAIACSLAHQTEAQFRGELALFAAEGASGSYWSERDGVPSATGLYGESMKPVLLTSHEWVRSLAARALSGHVDLSPASVISHHTADLAAEAAVLSPPPGQQMRDASSCQCGSTAGDSAAATHPQSVWLVSWRPTRAEGPPPLCPHDRSDDWLLAYWIPEDMLVMQEDKATLRLPQPASDSDADDALPSNSVVTASLMVVVLERLALCWRLLRCGPPTPSHSLRLGPDPRLLSLTLLRQGPDTTAGMSPAGGWPLLPEAGWSPMLTLTATQGEAAPLGSVTVTEGDAISFCLCNHTHSRLFVCGLSIDEAPSFAVQALAALHGVPELDAYDPSAAPSLLPWGIVTLNDATKDFYASYESGTQVPVMWVKVFFSAEEPLYDVPRSWEAPPLPFPSPWTSGSAARSRGVTPVLSPQAPTASWGAITLAIRVCPRVKE